MSLDIENIARTFCSWKFPDTYQYMANDIRWNVIGRGESVGREAVIGQCAQSLRFLETVTGTVTKLKTSRSGDTVFVEGAALFIDKQNEISYVASCDIFRFSGNRLVEITSYVIDLDKP